MNTIDDKEYGEVVVQLPLEDIKFLRMIGNRLNWKVSRKKKKQ